jgi:Activator of Hsp90 ATPase homolog 1-like protein
MTVTEVQTTQVYNLVIKATPEAIWEAITKPEFTERYFYGARIENRPDRHRSLGSDGSVWGDAPVYEFDPPRRLVQAGARSTTPSSPPRTRAASPGRSSPRRAATAWSPSPTTGSRAPPRPQRASPAPAG